MTSGPVESAGTAQPSQRYTRTAALLHWTIAAAIIGNLAMGYLCANIEFAAEDLVLNLHKVSGLLILVLSLFRLGWRLTHKAPALVYRSQAQRRAAHTVHAALYALMIAAPFTGWLVTSSFPKRHPISAGPFDLPFLPVEPSLPLAAQAHGAHELLAAIMAALVFGHVLAAAWHQWVIKDGLLDRMKG